VFATVLEKPFLNVNKLISNFDLKITVFGVIEGFTEISDETIGRYFLIKINGSISDFAFAISRK
jgi:hypothetical protein